MARLCAPCKRASLEPHPDAHRREAAGRDSQISHFDEIRAPLRTKLKSDTAREADVIRIEAGELNALELIRRYAAE